MKNVAPPDYLDQLRNHGFLKRVYAYLLQFHRHIIIPRTNLEIRTTEQEATNKRKEEDQCKNRICLQCKNPSREQPKAPNKEV